MTTKRRIILLVLSIAIISITTLVSYAYFVANVSGNDNAYNTVITTGEMTLSLNDGVEVGIENAIPGSSSIKTFSVKNTGTIQTNYDVYISEIFSDFVDKNDLVYTLSSTNGCPNNTESVIMSVNSSHNKIVSSCSIEPNQEHTYTLNILFKDDNTNQDDNKGKFFSGKISVNDYKKIAKGIDGPTFNRIAKELAGTTVTSEDQAYYEEYSYLFTNYGSTLPIEPIHAAKNTNVESVIIHNELPQNIDSAAKISSSDSDIDIYMTYENNALNIYSESPIMYFNENSTATFSGFYNLNNFVRNDGDFPFDYSYVSDAKFMYSGTGWTSAWTGNVSMPYLKNVMGMFAGCEKLKDLHVYFNESKLENMDAFASANPLLETIEFLDIDTSNVTSMLAMFNGDASLTEIDLSLFNTKNVVNMNAMFNGLSSLTTLNLGDNFDTSNVQLMAYMFAGAGIKVLDLGPKFNTSNVTIMEETFANMPNLTTIKTNELNLDKVVYPRKMFINSTKLVGGAGTRYNAAHAELDRAHIDGGTSNPGYFTQR